MNPSRKGIVIKSRIDSEENECKIFRINPDYNPPSNRDTATETNTIANGKSHNTPLPPKEGEVMTYLAKVIKEQEKIEAVWSQIIGNVNQHSTVMNQLKANAEFLQASISSILVILAGKLGVTQAEFTDAWESVTGEVPNEQSVKYIFGDSQDEQIY